VREKRMEREALPQNPRQFPVSAGILFGLELGGFFDGIVLHQVLQWHHMVTSAGYPADSVKNLEINTFFDGLFHAATYAFVVLGLILLWRTAHRAHLWWSWKFLAGTMLMGFGLFNVVEGVIDHHLLGLHHVNQTAPRDQWIYWDLGFLVWGGAMIAGGAGALSLRPADAAGTGSGEARRTGRSLRDDRRSVVGRGDGASGRGQRLASSISRAERSR
jgi:uncharacterized membrane protein